MKNGLIALLVLAAWLACVPRLQAQASSGTTSELKALVSRINDKLHAGKKTQADLATEIDAFNELIDKHKSEKTDETAQLFLTKAMLYLEVFQDTAAGTAIIRQMKEEYPDTRAGKSADAILANVQHQEKARQIQQSLVVGAKFPDFQEKDLDGKALAPSNYKGKVLLIDFWATWCGPCVSELPNVIKTYEKYHDKGFEIVGISLDQSETRLQSFLKEKNMTWPQYFDGARWENKLAQKYGIEGIPATFLLDGDGKIIGRDLRGDQLERAVTAALHL
jgi:peroxiredoxin